MIEWLQAHGGDVVLTIMALLAGSIIFFWNHGPGNRRPSAPRHTRPPRRRR